MNETDPNDKFPIGSKDHDPPADPWGEKQLPLQEEPLPAKGLTDAPGRSAG